MCANCSFSPFSIFILAGSTARRQLDLFRPKDDFLELVKGWDMYDEGSMGITVGHLTRFGRIARDYWLLDASLFEDYPTKDFFLCCYSSKLPAELLENGADQKKAKRSKSGKVPRVPICVSEDVEPTCNY